MPLLITQDPAWCFTTIRFSTFGGDHSTFCLFFRYRITQMWGNPLDGLPDIIRVAKLVPPHHEFSSLIFILEFHCLVDDVFFLVWRVVANFRDYLLLSTLGLMPVFLILEDIFPYKLHHRWCLHYSILWHSLLLPPIHTTTPVSVFDTARNRFLKTGARFWIYHVGNKIAFARTRNSKAVWSLLAAGPSYQSFLYFLVGFRKFLCCFSIICACSCCHLWRYHVAVMVLLSCATIITASHWGG